MKPLLVRVFWLLLSMLCLQASPEPSFAPLPLKQGWRLQSSAEIQVSGATLSLPGFDAQSWTATSVPATVLGALVDSGRFGEVFRDRNLEKIPSAPYAVSWWYRTEFFVPEHQALTQARLCFDGINYRAEVWLNGRRLTEGGPLVGAYRRHELDLGSTLKPGLNALAVEVFPPLPGDFTVGFVDWNPVPPDRNMGLFRGVHLERSGPVSLEAPFVRSEVDLKSLASADLFVEVELRNHTAQAQNGLLSGALGTLRFEVPYSLRPLERRPLRISPAEVPGLHIVNPQLWWPLHLGEPKLHHLDLTVSVGTRPSSQKSVAFGIRSVGDYLTPEGHRGYTVNGQKVLIRGGGWVDDLFLREEPTQLEAQLDYVRSMNLNTVRLEGFWGASELLYDLADQKGLLLMAGWSCQWEWAQYLGVPIVENETFGGPKKPADVELVTAYLRDQVRWLRNHPSLFVWVLGSDKLPWPEVEALYRSDLASLDPSRPLLAACKRLSSPLSGDSGVKMAGPYQYVPPVYWFDPQSPGGAFGFNTETGPGPQIPPLSSLKAMFSEQQLWPPNPTWDYHCGRYAFGDLKTYLEAFNQRYGPASSVEDLAFRAQAANYEAMRAMFEAFGAGRPRTTGLIQWMLNASWPKLYWQLYGYDLLPNGAFYGAQKACSPRHVVYDPLKREVFAVNDTLKDFNGGSLEVRAFDTNSSLLGEKRLRVNCPANTSLSLLELPDWAAQVPLHFLSLKLFDAQGLLVSDNTYWLSAKPDLVDLPNSEWWGTPLLGYADFTSLKTLPRAQVQVTLDAISAESLKLTLSNPSDKLAFFLELELRDKKTAVPLTPVFWEDNYLSLLPGEKRQLAVRFRPPSNSTGLELQLQGWNVPVHKWDFSLNHTNTSAK